MLEPERTGAAASRTSDADRPDAGPRAIERCKSLADPCPAVDLNYFIRQANKLTEKIEQRKKELAKETVEGKAGDGRVIVVATGVQEIKSDQDRPRRCIDPTTSAMLEDLVTAAVNAALTSSREHMQRELAKISGGMKIPGIT